MSFDDLLKELKGKKTQDESGQVSLNDLFNGEFMTKHSKHASFADFLEKGNFQVETHEDIANIPDEFFDRHVARETDFDSWKSMLDAATKAYERT